MYSPCPFRPPPLFFCGSSLGWLKVRESSVIYSRLQTAPSFPALFADSNRSPDIPFVVFSLPNFFQFSDQRDTSSRMHSTLDHPLFLGWDDLASALSCFAQWAPPRSKAPSSRRFFGLSSHFSLEGLRAPPRFFFPEQNSRPGSLPCLHFPSHHAFPQPVQFSL